MKQQSGFTLIETLVYLALFALFFGGAVVAAYNMFEGSSRSQTKSLIQEEGDFLQAKVEWALSGAQTISQPSVGTPLSTLQVSKYDGTILTIKLSGTNAQLQNNTNTYTLNNSSVQVSNLIFTHNSASGDGINPESVKAEFTLTAKTGNGLLISQVFSTTKYLRK